LTERGTLSCFVEVPFTAATYNSAPTARTTLQIGGYTEMLLSLDEVLSGSAHLGFLLAGPPLVLLGDQYQDQGADHAIALVKGVMPAVGTAAVGPSRCARCNSTVPAARARALGSTTLCVRCQSAIEEVRDVKRCG
jgi:hypothetical protein